MKHVYHDRFFVNPEGYGGSAVCHFLVNRDHAIRDAVADYQIQMTDCYKTVTLHGDLRTEEDLNVAILKIREIKEGFERFEEFLLSINK